MERTPQKELTGMLFKSDRNPKIDYSGGATIDGQEYWISGWVKESKKDGTKYLSLSFTAKEARQAALAEPSGEIPF